MELMTHTLDKAADMARDYPRFAKDLFILLCKPFSVNSLNEYRLLTLLKLAAVIDFKHRETILAKMAPHVLWAEPILHYRLECYKNTDNPLAKQAERDLQTFMGNAPKAISTTLSPQ